MSNETKKNRPTIGKQEEQIPIPHTFTKEQVEQIVMQSVAPLQKQLEEAKQYIEQLKQAFVDNNTSEIYRRVGMLLELVKQPDIFEATLISDWKTEILELVADTKLVKMPTE